MTDRRAEIVAATACLHLYSSPSGGTHETVCQGCDVPWSGNGHPSETAYQEWRLHQAEAIVVALDNYDEMVPHAVDAVTRVTKGELWQAP